MTANIVYSIVQALPKEEQEILLQLIQKNASVEANATQKKKPKLITDAEADAYILRTVFKKKT
jgi:hypothetical protein